MTMAVINGGKHLLSPEHHFSILLIEGQEDYDLLSVALRGLLQDLKELQDRGWQSDKQHVPVELYLTGDWKFLAIVLGLTVLFSSPSLPLSFFFFVKHSCFSLIFFFVCLFV
jgi:hypothetical protein